MMPNPQDRRRGVLVASLLVASLAAMPAAVVVAVDDIVVGTWDGILAGEGFELRVVFHIMRDDDGTLSATLDSPDQGAAGVPADDVTFEDGRLRLSIDAILGDYDGTLSDEGDTLEGTWSQAGQSLPLDLTRRADG
jgi:hypothetical protein